MSTTHPLAGTNLAVLVGVLSRDAEVRTLPSGDHLVALELTIRPPDGPTDTVPVAWHRAPDEAAAWEAGEELLVTGRVRRRYFRAGGATHSRTEVVAERVVPTRRAATVTRTLEAALGRL